MFQFLMQCWVMGKWIMDERVCFLNYCSPEATPHPSCP